jgi:methionyl aminopeptidase
MIVLKNEEELGYMRDANRIVAGALREVAKEIKPGVSTAELDRVAATYIRDNDGVPAFLGYHGFPGNICASINEVVVHGIPSKKRFLKDGDIVSIDIGVKKRGYFGDAAVTLPVGAIDERKQRLIDVTRESLRRGIEFVKPGARLGDVSSRIQGFVEENEYSVVREYVGHGIGREMHEAPSIPNYGRKGRGVKLEVGMTLAIEPMVNEGTYEVEVLDDGWTVVTRDRKLSAHFEHTVAVVPDGAEILSVL